MVDSNTFLRIIEIDKLIKNEEYPNCKYLQSHLKKSERTILRDIDELKNSYDAPIKYSKKQNGYYYYKEFELKDIEISEGELLALLVGRQILSIYKNTAFFDDLSNAFKKLSVLLPNFIKINGQDTYSFSIEMYNSLTFDKSSLKIFKSLLDALYNKKKIKVESIDLKDKDHIVSRKLIPVKLEFNHGFWFLVGLEEKTNKLCKISIRRIQHFRRLKETFQSHQVMRFLHSSESTAQDKHRVKVVFSNEVSEVVGDRLLNTPSKLTELPGNKLLVEFITADINSIYQWLLSFGPAVEIKEPTFLRSKVRKDLLSMLNQY